MYLDQLRFFMSHKILLHNSYSATAKIQDGDLTSQPLNINLTLDAAFFACVLLYLTLFCAKSSRSVQTNSCMW